MHRARDLQIDGWHGKPLGVSVVALALIALTPGLLFAAWYANSWATSERHRIEQTGRQAVSGIIAALDRHVTTTQSMLIALASSPSLQTDDIEGFYRQATQVARELGFDIVLRDLENNNLLVHTAFAFGEGRSLDIPPAAELATKQLVATGKPQVSGVFLGRRLPEHFAIVIVPVVRSGTARYTLSVILRAEAIANILSQTILDRTWTAAVVDQNGAIVARSRRHREFVGKPITSKYRGSFPPAGTYAGTVVDGTERAQFFFERSKVTQWRVTVAVPERVLAAPARWAFGSLGIASVLFLLGAGTLAHRFARRLSSKLGALQTAAIVERKLSEQQFHALAESVSNGIVAVSNDDSIVFLNAQIETMFGYGRDELIDRPIDILFPGHCVAKIAEWRHDLRTTPDPSAPGVEHELMGLRKDGMEFPIRVGLSLIDTTFGKLVMVTMADLTAQHQAMEHLSTILVERDDLRRRLMQAHEQERLRLARDLHDQTGQVVAAAMMELKSIEPFVNAEGRRCIHHLRERLDKMGKALHRIAWELRPASIDEVGLADTLTEYLSEWSAQFGIAAELFCRNKRINKLSDEVNTTVYRVVQEALTNTAKHARGATAVSVIVDFSGPELRLTIEDNGCGFDADGTRAKGKPRRRGLGLDGMRERLSLIGGSVEIESAGGVGTTLFIRIPLEQERMIA